MQKQGMIFYTPSNGKIFFNQVRIDFCIKNFGITFFDKWSETIQIDEVIVINN